MRRKTPLIPVGTKLHTVIEYSLLGVGAAIIALSFNLFLLPNKIASGGVAGISTIVEYRFGFEPAFTQWAINIPLFIAGILLLGGKFGVKTLFGSLLLPLLVLLTRNLDSPTDNLLLASIYGGIGIGVGLGIVFRGRGSTGGLDLAAQILHKYSGITLGFAIALLDGLVILTAGFVFSPENALYALIGLFVTSKTIDAIQIGFSFSKVAFIISDETEAMKKAILHNLDRGLTLLDGKGGYSNQHKCIMMVVVNQIEVTKLKSIAKAVDPNAFIILSDTSEVLGEGFKLTP